MFKFKQVWTFWEKVYFIHHHIPIVTQYSHSHKKWIWQSNGYLCTVSIQSISSIWEFFPLHFRKRSYAKTMFWIYSHLGFLNDTINSDFVEDHSRHILAKITVKWFCGGSHLRYLIGTENLNIQRTIQWLFMYSLGSIKFLVHENNYFSIFPQTMPYGDSHLRFPIDKKNPHFFKRAI